MRMRCAAGLWAILCGLGCQSSVENPPRHDEPPQPSVQVAAQANGVSILDDGDHTIGVTLLHAVARPPVVRGDWHVFERALPDADLLLRPLSGGFEDHLRLHARGRTEARYQVQLRRGISGLRLVNGVLEFLDASGVPRMRTAAPIVIDAVGTERRGNLDVEGCVVDRDPRPPFGRPVVTPGATTCVVRSSWSDEKLVFPVLVDPVWTTTKGAMVQKRARHTAVALTTSAGACASGCVLVFGGYSDLAYTKPVAVTELYSQATDTFTVVSSPTSDPWALNGLAPINGGTKALVFGGQVYPASGDKATAQTFVYDPTASPSWTAGPDMTQARANFCVAYDKDRVFASGGMSTAGLSDVVDVFEAGAWLATPPKLKKKRVSHFCGTVHTSDGLDYHVAAGGLDDTYVETTDAEGLGKSSTGWTSFAWGKLIKARTEGTSVRVGDALLTIGGLPITTSVERLADYGVTAPASTASFGRRAAAAAYGTGAVALAGDKLVILDKLGQATGTQPLTVARYEAIMTTLSSGAVLLTGGFDGTVAGANTLSTAEIFDLLKQGSSCKNASECKGGFCVDGVCCDSACAGQCQACNLPKTLGKCTTVDGTDAPDGFPKGQAVTGFGTTRAACASFETTCGFHCDGSSPDACTPAKTSVACSVGSCKDGVETKPAFCNGSGACLTPTTASCGDFACGATGCLSKCTRDDDCTKGRRCDTARGTCDPPKATCTNATTSQPVGGPAKDCTPYACDPATGACLGDCTTSDRCAPGYACADRACVPSAAPVTEDGGCTIDPRSKEGWAWPAALLALGWLGQRRRER